MDQTPRTPEERYGPAFQMAQAELRQRNPHTISEWARVEYLPTSESEGCFRVRFLDGVYTISYPDGVVQDSAGAIPHIGHRLIILHYLLHATGVPLADRWIAFRELPGGLGYDAVFQARVNRRLVGIFGGRIDAFREAAQALGGMPLSVGDAAFAFDAFPCLRVAVVMYKGDQDFPASANFIFDGVAEHNLPTEDLVVLGEVIAGRLTKLAAAAKA